MASPMPTASQGGWNPNGQLVQQNNEVDEPGVQVRPMGLKVHYTFDKESKVNCLARPSHTLNIQTIPLDDKNSIGVVDLRVCLQAVTECSPELASQEDNSDFTIYAFDYSEPDTPLVGQGMLSWALESMRGDWAAQPPKMVTGRVTKNLLAVFGGGNRETLEVKLKLSARSKVQRPEPSIELQPARPIETAMTPTGDAEWNSFIQSNPQIGHSAHVSRVASPALSQGPPVNTTQRRDSFGPSVLGVPTQEVQRVAPVPVESTAVPIPPASRPSSRSSRKKQSTGRPRGRPRKKPVEGNTSGYEDGTEGEDGGPAKKRAKTTKAGKAAPNPFTSGPDSLRVTASTAGSLRNFRPVATSNEALPGNHLQEVPRAPTPVPEGGPLSIPPRGGPKGPKPRRESSMRQELTANLSNQFPPRPNRALSPSQEDGRSPESPTATPAYSEDSPQDIRSSPPVPRTASFMHSSPPPSSPILPPMPLPQQQDSAFMDNDADDLFDEPILQPVKESRIQGPPQTQKVLETFDATGIPTQVFRIQNGPDGQDLVHIQNYNTPHPTSAPADPPQVEAPTLPSRKKKNPPKARSTKNPPQRQPKRPSPPPLAPTPPPTTDAPEKLASPAPAPLPSPADIPQPQIDQSTDGVDEALLQLVREASGSSEPALSIETNQSVQGSLPLAVPIANPPNPQPRAPRQLSRSQSAGALALPSVPASEPVGPSSLSQSAIAGPIRASTELPPPLRRSNSMSLHLPVPASDPAAPPELSFQASTADFSEALCPPSELFLPMPSSPPLRSNKNLVKKQSIKQRLETAIENGEMPPFCTNCGAIETPTWRKIWVQEHEGIPQYVEYSEKPGRITAIEILKRDDENNPLSYRIVKKSLGYGDVRKTWTEQLLCNPCGIWISKYHNHRPQDKWDNAFGPLGQGRRKRGSAGPNPRPKKARTKSDSQPNLTWEAYLPTDPLGPVEPSSPKQSGAPIPQVLLKGGRLTHNAPPPAFPEEGQPSRSAPGSTHSRASRGSGTAESPIKMDLDSELDSQLGTTRRLLFPSPRKDASPKTLGDLDVNIVKTTECRQNKEPVTEKENMAVGAPSDGQSAPDDLEALLHHSAPARPSTPPPKAKPATQSTPFKTPTRPTPNHRPITRSVSRSLRSVKDMMSPSQLALLQQTPTKTPHGSGSVRRSPRLNIENVFDTPLSRTITQMLSEPNFDLGNGNFDFSSLPALDTNPASLIEFGNFLSTDGLMPSSPPKDGSLGFDYSGSDNVWAEWGIEQKVTVEKTEE